MDEQHSARLLLAIVRQRWREAEELVRARPVQADRFVELCRESDVHPWVHVLLSGESRFDLVGPPVSRELQALRTKVRQDNLLLLARAEQALDLLLAAGIVPVALKGLDLLHRIYGSFDERTCDDVDLLIRREHLRPALETLERAGWNVPPEPRRTRYIRSSHHLPLRSPGPLGVDFEIHWNLAQEARYRVDVEGLFDRAVPLEIAGRRILRLEDHDLVAHLLVHHFSHYFDRRLKWLVDLQAIVRAASFRWERVARRARRWGATAVSAISLVHLHKLMPAAIPAEALRALPVAPWRHLLTLPLRSSHPLELFRNTRSRRIQLYLAAVMLERPTQLPGWLWHRSRRDRRRSTNPLDAASR